MDRSEKKSLIIILVVFILAIILSVTFLYSIDYLKAKHKEPVIDVNYNYTKSLEKRIFIEQSRVDDISTILTYMYLQTSKSILADITNNVKKYGLNVIINGEEYSYDINNYVYVDKNNYSVLLMARFPDDRRFNLSNESFVRYLFYNYTYDIHKDNINETLVVDRISYTVDYVDRYKNKTIRGILGDENDISNVVLKGNNKINQSVYVLYIRDELKN